MHLALFYLAKVYQKLKNPIFLHTVIFEILFYFVSYIIWLLHLFMFSFIHNMVIALLFSFLFFLCSPYRYGSLFFHQRQNHAGSSFSAHMNGLMGNFIFRFFRPQPFLIAVNMILREVGGGNIYTNAGTLWNRVYNIPHSNLHLCHAARFIGSGLRFSLLQCCNRGTNVVRFSFRRYLHDFSGECRILAITFHEQTDGSFSVQRESFFQRF